MSATARAAVALTVCVAVVIASGVVGGSTESATSSRPNVIMVVTDDQSYDTIVDEPAAMPWLASQLVDPESGWISFTNAVVTTPMCCPSRASILTGRYASATGVTSNLDGDDLDESTTVAVALQDAGYRTAMIGKYLNGYPWERGPYVPEGWDRWLAKTNDALATTYYGYGLVDQTTERRMGSVPGDYVTDVLGREAVRFVDTVDADVPWFLYFAPPAPHEPWTPAPRHEAFTARAAPASPTLDDVNAVDGKPGWVQALPSVTQEELDALQRARSAERATLLAVDEWLHAIVAAVARRGELEETVIIVTSDNGYHFGEHRWRGKQTPYEPSVHVPLSIRLPGVDGGSEDELVASIDLAATIADAAGVSLADPDGVSLLPLIREGSRPDRQGVALTWEGPNDVPAWSALRLDHEVYIRNSDGVEEYYDLTTDPRQLDDRFDALPTARVAELRQTLASLLIDAQARG